MDVVAEIALLRSLAQGDVRALDDALGRYWSPLVAYVIGLLDSREAAEDIAQEAFFRLWERRATLRIDGSLRGLLYQMARNLAISEQRRNLAFQKTACAVAEDQPSFAYIQFHEEAGELQEAVNRLPARRREILLLHSIHGLSYKEIAQLLGIAPQTVANQFSAAVSSLRRTFPMRPMV